MGSTWFPLAVLILAVLPPASSPGNSNPTTVSRGASPPVIRAERAVEAPRTTHLVERWRIGAEGDDVFGLIRGVTEDAAGNVYVLDYQLARVQVFSPDGKFLRTIGREGEGPGDLRRPDSLCLSPAGEVCVAMAYPSRIARFKTDGQPLDTRVLPERPGGGTPILVEIIPAGDHLVAHALDLRFEGDHELQVRYLCALDALGRETVRYHEETFGFDPARPVWEERSRALIGRWGADRDGSVVVAPGFSDYVLKVFEQDGGVRHVIERDYTHRKRSPAEKKFVRDWAGWNPAALLPDTRFEVEDHDRDIMNVYVRDGEYWVLSSRGFYDRPDGALGVFDVFDRAGRLLRQVTLAGAGDPWRDQYFFTDRHLYVAMGYTDTIVGMAGDVPGKDRFLSTDAEPMSVICYVLE